MIPVSNFEERTISSNENWIMYGAIGMNDADNQASDSQSNGRIVQNRSQTVLGRGLGSRR